MHAELRAQKVRQRYSFALKCADSLVVFDLPPGFFSVIHPTQEDNLGIMEFYGILLLRSMSFSHSCWADLGRGAHLIWSSSHIHPSCHYCRKLSQSWLLLQYQHPSRGPTNSWNTFYLLFRKGLHFMWRGELLQWSFPMDKHPLVRWRFCAQRALCPVTLRFWMSSSCSIFASVPMSIPLFWQLHRTKKYNAFPQMSLKVFPLISTFWKFTSADVSSATVATGASFSPLFSPSWRGHDMAWHGMTGVGDQEDLGRW